MRFRDREIEGIGGLLEVLDDQAKNGSLVWFRGQSDLAWQLVPGLGRHGRDMAEAENLLIKRFKQNAIPHLSSKPNTEWEWLFLMQHHRLKTRLLDWTESPLVGLFFAVDDTDTSSKGKDAALWCIDPVALNHHSEIFFEHGLEIPAFDQDDILNNYLPTTLVKEKTSHMKPIAAIAPRNSPRIAAQLGTFTISHRDFTPIEDVGEDVGDKSHVWRIIIPSDAKPKILKELEHLRHTRLTVFPELDSVAHEAQRMLS